jgi:hypothetical protein
MPPGAKNSCRLGKARVVMGRVVDSGAAIGTDSIIDSQPVLVILPLENHDCSRQD